MPGHLVFVVLSFHFLQDVGIFLVFCKPQSVNVYLFTHDSPSINIFIRTQILLYDQKVQKIISFDELLTYN